MTDELIELIALVLVFGVSFLFKKVKDFLNSIENESSHKKAKDSKVYPYNQSNANSKKEYQHKNRGADYRDAKLKKSKAKEFKSPILENFADNTPSVKTVQKVAQKSDSLNDVKIQLEPIFVYEDKNVKAQNLQNVLKNRDSLAQSILLSEILNKPIALRSSSDKLF